MCGRFSLTVDPEQLQHALPWLSFIPDNLTARYNIAPSQPIAVVANTGENKLDHFIWGLIPFWAKDVNIGNKMINARSETLAEKPSFKHAFKRRRCLVLASGFYEWMRVPGQKVKQPMYIQIKNRQVFAFAGLWEDWQSPDGSQIKSCAIITTEPNAKIRHIHNRMPVILEEESYPRWLATGEVQPAELSDLFVPYPGDKMSFYEVTRAVNNPRYDNPEIIQPVD